MYDQRQNAHASMPANFSGPQLCPQPIEHSTQAVRILNNGFVIASPRKLQVGSLLSLRLCIPPDVSGGPFWETRCIEARVTAKRIRRDGAIRYKVELDFQSESPGVL